MLGCVFLLLEHWVEHPLEPRYVFNICKYRVSAYSYILWGPRTWRALFWAKDIAVMVKEQEAPTAPQKQEQAANCEPPLSCTHGYACTGGQVVRAVDHDALRPWLPLTRGRPTILQPAGPCCSCCDLPHSHFAHRQWGVTSEGLFCETPPYYVAFQ